MTLPEIVLAAFHRAGQPVPTQERVDRIGYSAQEIVLIERELKRRAA